MITPRPVVMTAAFIGSLNAVECGPGSWFGLRSAHNSDLFAEPGQYCFAGEYPSRSHRVCCPGRSSSTLCVKERDRDEYDQSTAPSSSGSASAESPSSEMATCFRATSI